ncbi:accessory Sec system protein translocase subunit SecY2 [Liquorilactobacillus hordei]|uniref:Accessory Sec system protein translocase subunit SecY2 n=1 Tax=Liquorilactobacillus hordei TaxID=468911 RepID=A0A3S6QPB2_9LACO|nr:accessory Sec system protein translocase subunit SecY2 [Liquorilactobacillus hordei]AUJ29499.1 accessory Sec system protein translocase subunit SecY2 [Liquorilactobacillus hordei]
MDTKEKKELRAILFRKFGWTGLILLIYGLGRHITLPFIDNSALNYMMEKNHLLALSSGATGANLTQFSLFSLGLGPWMSAMIIWQLLMMIKKLSFDKLSQAESTVYQLVITLAIAIIEAWGMIATMPIQNFDTNKILIVITIMVSGSFFLVWLANMNMANGMGSSVAIIIYGMVGSIGQQLLPLVSREIAKSGIFIWLVLIILLIVFLIIFFSVILERAQYRIYIQRILIDNIFSKQTYLPIKLNSGGGMAIMFGTSLLMVPSYLVAILIGYFPHNHIIAWFAKNISLSSNFGVTVYILIIFALAIAFSFINTDTEKIAENLQKSGDYIIGLRPGKQTEKSLRHYVLFFGIFGAFYTVLIAGIPLYIGVIYPNYRSTLMVPGFIMMMVGMILTIIDQYLAIKRLHSYPAVFNMANLKE